MFLRGKNIQLIPFTEANWGNLACWYYDEQYKGLFRQYSRAFSETDMRNYPKVVGGEVFMIHLVSTGEVIGMCQFTPDWKKNRAAYTGCLIDVKFQGNRYQNEVYALFYNYLFNTLGFKKIIVEVLESNASLKKAAIACGFLFEGTLYRECFMDGQFHNELRYSMSDEFFNRKYGKASV